MLRQISVLIWMLASWPAMAAWPLSELKLGPAYGEQIAPAVCAGGEGFVAAWQDLRSTQSVRVTRLDAHGNVVDPLGTVVWTQQFGDRSALMYGPEVLWNGAEWLVLFTRGAELGVARVSPETGSLAVPIVWHRYEDVVPWAQIRAVVAGNRVFVVLNRADSLYVVVLDQQGLLVAPPRSLRTEGMRGQPLVASDGTDVLVFDFDSKGAVAYRVGLDGVPIERNELSGPSYPGESNELVVHGGNYLYVRQRSGVVESWTIAHDARSINSYALVNSTVDPNPWGDGLALIPGTGGTEILYLAPASTDPNEKFIRRTSLSVEGALTVRAFEVRERTFGGLSAVSTPALTVLVTNRLRGSWRRDVVARSAGTLDGIPAAQEADLAISAPAQLLGRAVRSGSVTLVLWQEFDDAPAAASILVTKVGATGPETAPRLLFETEFYAYSIAGDGAGNFLVARYVAESIQLRQLGSNLEWLDSDWTTLARTSSSYFGDEALAWDGGGWWIGWIEDSGVSFPVWKLKVQRFSRELQPLTGVVDPGGTEPTSLPRLVAAGGELKLFWLNDPSPCVFPGCPPPHNRFLASSLDASGSIVNGETRIADDVTDDGSIAIEWNGTELLAAWQGARGIEATRVTPGLVALDTSVSEGEIVGVVLETADALPIDLGWDGTHWVAVHYPGDEPYGEHYRPTFRRFAATGDLSADWRAGATRALGIDGGAQLNGRGLIAAGAGGPTLVIQEMTNAETTGVVRYFVRNMTDAQRRRSVRR
ncbi:MAG: hypothetical protein WC538_14905 [Thermoanaerobaculia bacterium]|jgi:hypothetical protein